MIRYTTPTETFTVENIDLSDATSIKVTFKQKSNVLTVDGTATYEEPDSTISCTLTQEQTGSFAKGKLDVQANAWWGDKRDATYIGELMVYENLLDEVLP